MSEEKRLYNLKEFCSYLGIGDTKAIHLLEDHKDVEMKKFERNSRNEDGAGDELALQAYERYVNDGFSGWYRTRKNRCNRNIL